MRKKTPLAPGAERARPRPRTRQLLTLVETAEVFERLAADRPDPRTELVFSSPYTLLVAVVLSAQATDVAVNRATAGLFRAADTPQKMVELGEDKVADHIRTIGLWRMKARNVVAFSRILIDEHGGIVPKDRACLEKLPGVGRKTASVVLSEAFGEATIAVDTHVFRVANRTGLVKETSPDKVEARLMKRTPEAYRQGAHHWLILHGRYTCIARRPRCGDCVISDLCVYPEKTDAK